MTKREAIGPTDLGILSGSYQYRPDAPRQLDPYRGRERGGDRRVRSRVRPARSP